MRARLLSYWEAFHTSFWFVPSWFLIVAILAAILLPLAEAAAGEWLDGRLAWIEMSRESAESTLGMIATSMITVSGVVFSVTVVSLSIVSSQFGSRILRAMIADRVTQGTIGLFLGTAAFCFVLLRSMSLNSNAQFVPSFAVAVAVLLTLVAMAVLIHFIHHVAVSSQAPTVINRLSHDFKSAIDEVYPDEASASRAEEDRREHSAEAQMEWTAAGTIFAADRDGYLQAVDTAALVALARHHQVCIEVLQQVGEFVVEGEPLAKVRPEIELDGEFRKLARRAIVFGRRRTPWQDVSFAARELVEMALRALSPGINDPFTAVTCIDRLGAGFRCVATRRMPSPFHFDEEGELRLIHRYSELDQLLEHCFSPLRQFGCEHLSVMIAMFAAIDAIDQAAVRSADRAACRIQARRTWAACQRGLWQEADLERCEAIYRDLDGA